MLAGQAVLNVFSAMDRRGSKLFGPDYRNVTRFWITVNYLTLWGKFRACPAVIDFFKLQ